jgi:cytochrome c oxidase subunit 2
MRARTFLFLACALPLIAAAAPFQDALKPTGVQAEHIHSLWEILLWTCTAVFIAVVGACGLALWRAPRATENTPADAAVSKAPERPLMRAVVVSSTISIAGLVALVIASVLTDRALATLPLNDGVAIQVTANQWWWDIKYEADQPSKVFTTANELHIPVGRPVIVQLNARDVIHSFWVPNLHGKKDLIPGRTSTIQFRADKPGIYRGQCAEFCGYEHAKMAFLVIAEPPDEYEKWVAAQRSVPQEPTTNGAKRGQTVFMNSTCVMCHTIQGTTALARTAPDLTHVASRLTLAAGTLANTRGNLAGWILDPQNVKPGANMPAHSFASDDLNALLDYLESLK